MTMNSTLLVLALAFCFAVDTSRSPSAVYNFVATIVLAVIAVEVTVCAVARPRTKPGLVSSPPVPPSSASISSSASFSSSSLSSSLSISTSSRANYEVFLSFRGPDIRKKFADYLYTRLICAGINVFRDDNDLDPGENIRDALVQFIKQSEISIPIISQDYASSSSCLTELAEMMACKKAGTQSIVPIFYDIDPTDLKSLGGCVGEFFRWHENRKTDGEVIVKWKQACREIHDIKGYYLPNINDGYHGASIEKIVSHIQDLLETNDLEVPGDLVEIEHHVREVMKKLGVIYVNKKAIEVYDENVRVLGICGMPGIGKTIVAKVVYNKIHHLFESHSFLSDIPGTVESNKLMRLLKQLISNLQRNGHTRQSTRDQCVGVIKKSFKNKKVIIFLDDVQDFDQIKHFVGRISWFGKGSKILMTVRTKDVLNKYGHGVADTYEVEPMKPCHALQLFRNHAFCGYPPEEGNEYDSLSKEFVDSIDGLPLAIKVTASSLSNISDIEFWKETLLRGRRKLDQKVEKAFNVSYDSLSYVEEAKEIFLDIACFCSGMDQKIPSYMWCETNYPSRGIKFLCDRCLIKITENNQLWMHNQVRKFGREIVRKESPRNPRQRSRLWEHADALSTLMEKKSATKVEALCLKFDEGQSECLRPEAFGHLLGLRYLNLDQATIEGSSQIVLPKLRWLEWQGCRQISELLIFHLEELVILDLPCSLINGSPELGQILEKAKNLKVLILSGCPHQHATPDFYFNFFREISSAQSSKTCQKVCVI